VNGQVRIDTIIRDPHACDAVSSYQVGHVVARCLAVFSFTPGL